MAPMYNLLYNIVMDLGCKRANDLISKNLEISRAAARAIVDTGDIETFKKLSEKSEFIFDFIKEKIAKNLCGAVNAGNLQNVFKFTKIYSLDFENFIVNSWVKFANEDLTDEILALFEEGDNGQKAYAAAYFCQINDPVAVEYLEKFAFSDFEPLAQNCALALNKFNDRRLYSEALNAIKSANSAFEADSALCVTNIEADFEKYKYVNFLVSYSDKDAFDALFQYFKNTCSKSFAASSILYLTPLFELVEKGKTKEALEVFDTILGAYPEEISLETVFDFEILDFVKYLCKMLSEDKFLPEDKNEDKNSLKKDCTTQMPAQNAPNISSAYVKRIILKAKYQFYLISREDIYTFDLSKDVKKEVSNISEFLNTIKIDLFKGLEEELALINNAKNAAVEAQELQRERILETFDIILNFGKTEFAEKIAKTVLVAKFEDIISEGVRILKTFGKLELLNKEEILDKIKNPNLKALTESYFSL